jgi:predicted dehydrogenase
VCEKPTALSEAEAWQMHAAVAAAPVPRLCVVDHELRFLPTVQAMRSLLRAQYCGTLFYLRLTINSPRMLSDRVRLNTHTERQRDAKHSQLSQHVHAAHAQAPTYLHARKCTHVREVRIHTDSQEMCGVVARATRGGQSARTAAGCLGPWAVI